MSAAAPKAIPMWISDDGWVTNLRIERSAPAPLCTKPRPRLTPAQRGRFWSSVGQAIEAVRVGLLQGEKRADR